MRVQLFDALSKYGPDTATGLAQRLGESSGATSYHLRELAKHDFVREVVGKGTGRERWWERTPGGVSLEAGELSETIAGRTASDLVMRQWQQNSENALTDFIAHGVDLLGRGWIDSGSVSVSNLRLTVEQLAELTDRVMAIIDAAVIEYRSSNEPGSRPVQVQVNAFPLIDGEETPS